MVQTATEAVRIEDVVAWEQQARFSRKALTVLDGQTIALGELCKLNSADKVVAGAAAVNAVQTITPSVGGNADCVQVITCTGTSSGGTMKIGVRSLGEPNGAIRWSDTIAWSATEATMTASIQAALDDLLGANVIVVTEIPDTATPVITLTFSGTGATNKVHGEVGVDVSAMTGCANADVAITTQGAGTITAGAWRIKFVDLNGVVRWTPEIAFNANAAAINVAIDDALGSTLVVATGGPMSGPTAVVLTFSGAGYLALPQTLAAVDVNDLAGCDDVDVAHTVLGCALNGDLSVVALEAASPSGADGAAVFLVRDAVVVKENLTLATGTVTQAVIDVLETNSRIIVRSGPTYIATG